MPVLVTSVVRIVTFTNRFHALSHFTTIRNNDSPCRKKRVEIQIQKDTDKNGDIDFAVFGGCWLTFRGNCEESVENEIVTGRACVSGFVRVPTSGR